MTQQVETRFTTDLFFVNSQEALEKVREFSPQVEEFDAMLSASLSPERLEELKAMREIDILAYASMLREIIRTNYFKLRAAWVMIPEVEESEQFIGFINQRAWAYQREIGNGAFCSSELTFFLYDMVWACAGTDTNEWFAVRDKTGPSFTKGIFEKRFKETRLKKIRRDRLTGISVNFVAAKE